MTAEAIEPPTPTPENQRPDIPLPRASEEYDSAVGAAALELISTDEEPDIAELLRSIDADPRKIAEILTRINVGPNPSNRDILEEALKSLLGLGQLADIIRERISIIGHEKPGHGVVLSPSVRADLIDYVLANQQDNLLASLAMSANLAAEDYGSDPDTVKRNRGKIITRIMPIMLALLPQQDFEDFVNQLDVKM